MILLNTKMTLIYNDIDSQEKRERSIIITITIKLTTVIFFHKKNYISAAIAVAVENECF